MFSNNAQLNLHFLSIAFDVMHVVLCQWLKVSYCAIHAISILYVFLENDNCYFLYESTLNIKTTLFDFYQDC